MYISTALGLVAALAAPATAFFRIPCPGRIVSERADPIVDPGEVSGHVHTISGGNGFGFNMTYEQARTSTCSSCPITQDLSNYWTPKLYYQYENGSFQDVPQSGDGNGVYGGMTVYYLQRPGSDNDTLYAFPEGFRMLAGNPYKRNSTDDFASQAVSFVCLDYSGTSNQYTGLPTQNCPDGIRAQIFFPSCWDGVHLDSADHKSHMSYPASGAYNDGPCPASHPVHMISLFFEVIYDGSQFADMWYGDGQPFVFAMGDPTGYGFHGDFVNGWDVDVLQQAVTECTDLSGLITDCPAFEFFTTEQSQACIVPPQVDEAVTGILDALPGCNPVTDGPGLASAVACAAGVIGPFEQYFTDVTGSLGYEYIGCGSDSAETRTLTAQSESLASMDVETCVSYCSDAGYTYAGLEYSSQCYCGNSIASDRAPVAHVLGNCFSTCEGNSSEYCGGSAALSLYQKCSSGNCTNIPYTAPYADGDVASTLTGTTASSAISSVASLVSSVVSSVVGSSSSSSSSSSSASSSSVSSYATTTSSAADAYATSSSSSTSSTTSSTSIISSSSSSSVTPTAYTTSVSTATATATSSSSTSSSNNNNQKKNKLHWSSRQRARFAAAWHDHEISDSEAAAVKARLAEF